MSAGKNFGLCEPASEPSSIRRSHIARRSVASASAKEGVRLAGNQGRGCQGAVAPWQATYHSQTTEYSHMERAAARSGPSPTRHWGSSPREVFA